MATIEGVLAAVLLLGIVVVIVLLWRIRSALSDANEIDTDQLTAAVSRSLNDLEFRETIGQVEQHAQDMQDLHSDITEMLRNPSERGEFGEAQLEVILENHLPQEMFGIRKQVVDGKVPDAYIESSDGFICIDSKHSLDNYIAYINEDDPDARDEYRRSFRTDLESKLEKIASDYVQPEHGTTQYAFAFIPSESAYYHLITEERDLLQEYTEKGVLTVSPLTLGQRLELVKAGVKSRQLTEDAKQIQRQLERLGSRFADLDDIWDTLYGHINHAKDRAEEFDRAHTDLRAEFDRIDRISIDRAE